VFKRNFLWRQPSTLPICRLESFPTHSDLDDSLLTRKWSVVIEIPGILWQARRASSSLPAAEKQLEEVQRMLLNGHWTSHSIPAEHFESIEMPTSDDLSDFLFS
jgi:hypothetical protein